MCYEINYLHGRRVLSAGVDMAEKLSLCFYMPVSQLVVKIGCLSAYRCSVYGAVHLRKVGRFPAISAHLRKVGRFPAISAHLRKVGRFPAISAHLRKVEFRRCTHGTPSGLLWFGFTFSTGLSTFGRWDDIAGKLRTFRRSWGYRRFIDSFGRGNG